MARRSEKTGRPENNGYVTILITLFRQRKYMIKKYVGKIFPRLFTGKEAQDSAKQRK